MSPRSENRGYCFQRANLRYNGSTVRNRGYIPIQAIRQVVVFGLQWVHGPVTVVMG